jgi:methyl-accepting chemotaxis protein
MVSQIFPISVAIAPVPLILEVIYFWRKLMLERKTIEFKINLLLAINVFIITEITMFLTGFFIDNIAAVLILTPFSIVINMGIVYYILSALINQKQKTNANARRLENILQSGLDTSINVANNATELAASANEVNATAEEIAATTMEVSLKAQNQAEALDKIKHMAQEIEVISKVVSSISEQTNLLALNASIEAGRAGEHGRGFSVVAEKVQKLAEEAKNSVEKTSGIVEKISSSIQLAAEGSVEISNSMEEISSSAEEQTASMEEISATSEKLGLEAQNLKAQLSQQESGKMITK